MSAITSVRSALMSDELITFSALKIQLKKQNVKNGVLFFLDKKYSLATREERDSSSIHFFSELKF